MSGKRREGWQRPLVVEGGGRREGGGGGEMESDGLWRLTVFSV